MHEFNDEVEDLADEILAYALERLKKDPPLDGPKSPEELLAEAGNTITPSGLGGQKTLQLFREVLAKACISTDHPRYLAFIPSAPSEYSSLFDLVVGATAVYGGSWLEGAGAVFAENQALRWIADLAGLPKSAGGVFAQGGTIGNLSALVVAREFERIANKNVVEWVITCNRNAHSSIKAAAMVMDALVLQVEPGEDGVMRGEDLDRAIGEYEMAHPTHKVFAVVATAGSTNLGIVDDLDGCGRVAQRRDIWFHVDGAYGLAGLCAPSVRPLFNGIERADSLIVDPHKWLFAPFDACALIYQIGRAHV